MAWSPLEPALGSPPQAPAPAPVVRRYSSPAAVVEEILETARQRSISFQSGELSMSVSPRRRPLPQLHEHDEVAAASDGGPESSADEQTVIMRRANPRMDYQSTTAAASRPPTTRSSSRLDAKRAGGRRAERPPRDEEPPDGSESWWRRQVEKYGAIELDNKGSVARDHLALERTFLAWLRTSLAFASIGIAVTQLFRLSTSLADPADGDPYLRLRQLGKPLGATFLGISILTLFIGFYRYFETQHWIIRGKFPVSRGSVALVAVVALALMITSLVVVLVAEPSSFEKRSF